MASIAPDEDHAAGVQMKALSIFNMGSGSRKKGEATGLSRIKKKKED